MMSVIWLKRHLHKPSHRLIKVNSFITKKEKALASNFSVLVTRPEPAATQTANLLGAARIKAIKEPLLEISLLNASSLSLDTYQAIITTSAMAIRALSRISTNRNVPLWCVGEASKQTALELGFKNIFTPEDGEENAQNLILSIRKNLQLDKGSFLYIRGDHIQTDLKGILNTFGCKIDSMILYKSRPKESFSSQARDFLLSLNDFGLKGITFFSLRTVDIFLKLCHQEGIFLAYERFVALSLSAAITKQLEKFPWFKIITASTTTQLIANVIEIIQKDDINDHSS